MNVDEPSPADPAQRGDAERRRELGAFLRSRRGALPPENRPDHAIERRRVKGLRREEVAQRLGVSVSWYTKLEQGLDVNASPRLLSRIADVLCLSHVERVQLMQLGLVDGSGSGAEVREESVAVAQMIIDAMRCSPAFVLTPRADYIACNVAARAVFGDFEEFAGNGNQLVALFLDDKARASLPDWRESARRQVAMFRAGFARNLHDADLRDFVADLCERSDEFRELWGRYELPSATFRKVHITYDEMQYTFDHFTFFADFENQLRVEVFNPADEHTLRKMTALLADA